MAASSAPTVKQKILDLLAARAGLTGVRITWGGPAKEDDITGEMIHFDGDVTRRPEWVRLGAARLDERYTLTLAVVTIKAGATEKATEQRAWTLINEIEQAVRANQDFDDLIVDSEFGDQTVNLNPTPDGWLARGTIALDCHAVI